VYLATQALAASLTLEIQPRPNMQMSQTHPQLFVPFISFIFNSVRLCVIKAIVTARLVRGFIYLTQFVNAYFQHGRHEK